MNLIKYLIIDGALNSMKNLAIIPARSGSKGLKDKNIKLLNGKPMIAYTIEAATRSGMFEYVHVSTDSEKYAEISKKYGAYVPFLRDKELSDDNTSSWDVVQDVLNRYKGMGLEFDTFALLQPTSPLRNQADIKNAYNLYKAKNAKSVVSVCETDCSPMWMNELPNSLSLDGFIKANIGKRRQDLPTFYKVNGAIYISDCTKFNSNHNLYNEEGFAYIMEKRNSVDVDDEFDFELVNFILEINKNKT
jgi:CMP-N,N'-diacetyllegionaminic acid synthase